MKYLILAILALGASTTLAKAQVLRIQKNLTEIGETDDSFNCTIHPEECRNLGRCDPQSNGAYCECTPDYARPGCTYKRKSQTVAFLLTFFLGLFGAGRFYLGLYASAIPKLLLWLLFGIPCCPSTSSEEPSQDSIKACVSVVTLMMFIWWLTDVIIIGVGHISDGNGMDMKTW